MSGNSKREIEYIIVQAGGKGTRLGPLTRNKPKALVPVGNRPMLFHLFERFPDKKFIIITDYKGGVMRRYLEAFAPVAYLTVDAAGKTGTAAGINAALKAVPRGEPFALIWSDLVLPEGFALPDGNADTVGLSRGFTCRWRYENGVFEEIPSDSTGVAGFFTFRDKTCLDGLPDGGEFVRWLQSKNYRFREVALTRTREYGVPGAFEGEDGSPGRCRPFNSITEEDGRLVKRGVDEQGRALAVRERAWYRYVRERGYGKIPEIYAYEPLVMEKVPGKNVFLLDLTPAEKEAALRKIVAALRELHSLGGAPADRFSLYDAYPGKTFRRLGKVRDLIPFADRPEIMINGERCPNAFYCRDEIERAFTEYDCPRFALLHGDCTFSNIILRDGGEPVLIDPRGYFGTTELFGDPAYDWAKLYYSVAGNYDMFNRKRFSLDIGEEGVTLEIESSGWEDLAPLLLRLVADEADERSVKLIHAIIWLSLTTYAWEDYDSICGAFYNGCRYLRDALGEDQKIDIRR